MHLSESLSCRVQRARLQKRHSYAATSMLRHYVNGAKFRVVLTRRPKRVSSEVITYESNCKPFKIFHPAPQMSLQLQAPRNFMLWLPTPNIAFLASVDRWDISHACLP